MRGNEAFSFRIDIYKSGCWIFVFFVFVGGINRGAIIEVVGKIELGSGKGCFRVFYWFVVNVL